ncbi:unnamed protein product [Anisakis simplex]|uniref:Uncharacterized protein n=1 Tax=Anisakis simplex TaxID=6269 RepID=A0A0M3JU12_ANISI|nr:unnamed protein product [Anisakis simplex]
MNAANYKLRRYGARAFNAIDGFEQEETISRRDIDDAEQRFFDSTAYRCCFSIFHAKIGTFVVVTLVFHEIVIGILYLLSRDEFKYHNFNAGFSIVFLCRILQLPFAGIMYLALWQQKRTLIIPFAVSQLTLGCFADISSLVMLIYDEFREPHSSLPFTGSLRSLNLVLPLFIYTVLVVCLMGVLYQCSVYFRDRCAHERRRKQLKQQNTELELALGRVDEVQEPLG